MRFGILKCSWRGQVWSFEVFVERAGLDFSSVCGEARFGPLFVERSGLDF